MRYQWFSMTSPFPGTVSHLQKIHLPCQMHRSELKNVWYPKFVKHVYTI